MVRVDDPPGLSRVRVGQTSPPPLWGLIVGRVSVSTATPGGAVARLAGEHWPRFWPGCDAPAVAADILGRLRSATVAWGLADVQVMSGGVVGLVCSATSHGSN